MNRKSREYFEIKINFFYICETKTYLNLLLFLSNLQFLIKRLFWSPFQHTLPFNEFGGHLINTTNLKSWLLPKNFGKTHNHVNTRVNYWKLHLETLNISECWRIHIRSWRYIFLFDVLSDVDELLLEEKNTISLIYTVSNILC